MSYQFKVGDKGKTTAGVEYEIISAMVPPYDNKAFVVRFPGRAVGTFCRNENGKAFPNMGSLGDLLPPTRTVYVNLHKEHQLWLSYGTEELARNAALHATTVVAVAIPVEIQG